MWESDSEDECPGFGGNSLRDSPSPFDDVKELDAVPLHSEESTNVFQVDSSRFNTDSDAIPYHQIDSKYTSNKKH